MNGTPAFHGSTQPRRIWDYVTLGNGNDQHGAGWYFTSNRFTAIGYAANPADKPTSEMRCVDCNDPDYDGYLHSCRLLIDDEVWENIAPNTEDEWEVRYADKFRELIRQAPNFKDNMSDWGEDIEASLDESHDAMMCCDGPFDAIQQAWYDHYRGEEQAWAETVVKLFGWDCGMPPQFDTGEQHYVVWNPDCICMDKMEKYEDVKDEHVVS